MIEAECVRDGIELEHPEMPVRHIHLLEVLEPVIRHAVLYQRRECRQLDCRERPGLISAPTDEVARRL